EFGRFVEIVDAARLDEACAAARDERIAVLDFRDPTKIPLEIVLPAAAGASGTIVTVARDVEEAEIIFGVLEVGSAGVLMAAAAVPGERGCDPLVHARAGRAHAVPERTGGGRQGPGCRRERPHPPGHRWPGQDRDAPADRHRRRRALRADRQPDPAALLARAG